jgi:hypothetical protein
VKIIIKIDLKDLYHRLPIREGDKWKMAFRIDIVEFLGLIVSPMSIIIDPTYIEAIRDWATPKNIQGTTDVPGVCVTDHSYSSSVAITVAR